MLDFFRDYTIAEILEDILGAVALFALVFMFPYILAIAKAVIQ
jgi:hypothetical protein